MRRNYDWSGGVGVDWKRFGWVLVFVVVFLIVLTVGAFSLFGGDDVVVDVESCTLRHHFTGSVDGSEIFVLGKVKNVSYADGSWKECCCAGNDDIKDGVLELACACPVIR